MQHADDFGSFIRGELVEDQMATHGEYAIARSNMITGFTNLRVVAQSMERLVEFGQVAVSLFTSPGSFGEYRNPFQIGSGCSLDSETRHQ